MVNPSQLLHAIFFDLGFTLIDFKGDFYSVMEESYKVLANALVKAGYDLPVNTFSVRFSQVITDYYRGRDIDMVERPVEDYLSGVMAEFGFSHLPSQTARAVLEEMYRFTENYWEPADDAIETLTKLSARGYRLGLITNAANADNANRLIDRFGLRPFFEVILISSQEKMRKPDARIYTRGLTLLNLRPQNAMMVGDNPSADILGAQQVGMKAVWIDPGQHHPGRSLTTPGVIPDAVIHTLSELLKLV